MFWVHSVFKKIEWTTRPRLVINSLSPVKSHEDDVRNIHHDEINDDKSAIFNRSCITQHCWGAVRMMLREEKTQRHYAPTDVALLKETAKMLFPQKMDNSTSLRFATVPSHCQGQRTWLRLLDQLHISPRSLYNNHFAGGKADANRCVLPAEYVVHTNPGFRQNWAIWMQFDDRKPKKTS